jgi:hypothetical protein
VASRPARDVRKAPGRLIAQLHGLPLDGAGRAGRFVVCDGRGCFAPLPRVELGPRASGTPGFWQNRTGGTRWDRYAVHRG